MLELGKGRKTLPRQTKHPHWINPKLQTITLACVFCRSCRIPLCCSLSLLGSVFRLTPPISECVGLCGKVTCAGFNKSDGFAKSFGIHTTNFRPVFENLGSSPEADFGKLPACVIGGLFIIDRKRQSLASKVPRRALADPLWRRDITPEKVMLFRYSELTFNGQPIPRDRRYVTTEEG